MKFRRACLNSRSSFERFKTRFRGWECHGWAQSGGGNAPGGDPGGPRSAHGGHQVGTRAPRRDENFKEYNIQVIMTGGKFPASSDGGVCVRLRGQKQQTPLTKSSFFGPPRAPRWLQTLPIFGSRFARKVRASFAQAGTVFWGARPVWAFGFGAISDCFWKF